MRLRVTFAEDPVQQVKFSSNNVTFNPTIGEVIALVNDDYETLKNKPQINGIELIGNKTGEELDLGSAVFPSDGQVGDLLTKISTEAVGWITPASSVEQDNTRPITAAAVYTEIGNIHALLEII